MANNTYYPSRKFDDNFVAFVQMAQKAGWTFPNVDMNQLAEDAVKQREERAQLDLVKAETAKSEAEFATRQLERFQRFSAVLHAARGAFRNDTAVTAKLDLFKRRSRARSKAASQVSSPELG